MSAAGSSLFRGLGSAAKASRQQQLVQSVVAMTVKQPEYFGSIPLPSQAEGSLRQRIAPLLTDFLYPRVRAPVQDDPARRHACINMLQEQFRNYHPLK